MYQNGRNDPFRNRAEEGMGTLTHYQASRKRAFRNVWLIILAIIVIILIASFIYGLITGDGFIGTWHHIFHMIFSHHSGDSSINDVGF